MRGSNPRANPNYLTQDSTVALQSSYVQLAQPLSTTPPTNLSQALAPTPEGETEPSISSTLTLPAASSSTETKTNLAPVDVLLAASQSPPSPISGETSILQSKPFITESQDSSSLESEVLHGSSPWTSDTTKSRSRIQKPTPGQGPYPKHSFNFASSTMTYDTFWSSHTSSPSTARIGKAIFPTRTAGSSFSLLTQLPSSSTNGETNAVGDEHRTAGTALSATGTTQSPVYHS